MYITVTCYLLFLDAATYNTSCIEAKRPENMVQITPFPYLTLTMCGATKEAMQASVPLAMLLHATALLALPGLFFRH